LYLAHCRIYYRKPSGRPTREANNVRDALRSLLELAGDEPVETLSPRLLRDIQQHQIKSGKVSRKTINARINRIRRMARWAAVHEHVPDTLPGRLSITEPLRAGRTTAPEGPGIRPVPWEHVAATLTALAIEAEKPRAVNWAINPAMISTMIMVHWWTGCRPGEVCRMRRREIDRSGDVWLYRPAEHKTEHHQIERVIAIGPQAQQVLGPYLQRHRREVLFPGRWLHKPITENGYSQVIRRINRDYALKLWAPSQIRHSAATRLTAQAGGLEPVRALLGHTCISTTQIYAERDLSAAVGVAQRFG
jgi:integrase